MDLVTWGLITQGRKHSCKFAGQGFGERWNGTETKTACLWSSFSTSPQRAEALQLLILTSDLTGGHGGQDKEPCWACPLRPFLGNLGMTWEGNQSKAQPIPFSLLYYWYRDLIGSQKLSQAVTSKSEVRACWNFGAVLLAPVVGQNGDYIRNLKTLAFLCVVVPLFLIWGAGGPMQDSSLQVLLVRMFGP